MGILIAVGRTVLDLGGIYFWILVLRILVPKLVERYRRWRWQRIRVKAAQLWREQHRGSKDVEAL